MERDYPEVFAGGSWLHGSVFIVVRRIITTMASKKRQKCPKQKLQVISQDPMKTSDDDDDDNKRHETASLDEDEEDEDALEMERNFALFNKRGSVQTSERTEEETSGEESEEEEEEEDDSDGTESEEQRTDTGSTSHLNKPETGLSTLSFEELMKLQSKVGTKACKRLIHASQKKKRQNSEPAKHVTRNGPQEISAKKPVSFLRNVCSAKRPVLRDPRFDDLSGEFKPEVFDQTYKFIEDIRQREAKMVRKQLKNVKSKAKQEELRSFLKRMENQKRNQDRLQQQREKELSYKRKQRALVEDGHRPYYLKKSDKKKLQLAEKYSELKKSGKLENFLSKKRKRNAVKDRRKMP